MLLRPGRFEELKQQMKLKQLDILGVCKTRWGDNGDFWSDDFRMINSGDKQGKNGVGILLNKEWGLQVENTYRVNDTILLIKLKTSTVNMIVIQVYFPTSNSEDEMEQVYDSLDELLGITRDSDNVIIMSDFNAGKGEGQDNQIVGKHGLGRRNIRGERLVNFCKQNNFLVTNTMFEVPKIRRYTWVAPGDTNRYQMDYVLAKSRFKKQVMTSHSFPSAEIDCDHNLVVMKYKIIHKKVTKRPKFHNRVIAAGIGPPWEEAVNNIRQSAEESIGFRKLNPRKPWIANEIMDLIKYRNKLRKTDDAMNRIIKNRITQKCRVEKEEWMDITCKNIKINMTANRMDKAYGMIKRLSRLPKPRSKIVKNRNGQLILDEGEIATRWKEYIEDLYKGLIGEHDMNNENIIESNEEDIGPNITKSEFVKALSELKQGKATGVDDIPAELLKNVGKDTEYKLFEMIEKMYRDGNIPEDFAKSKIVLIPKKRNSTECKNYRIICLG
ncbi:craniofacial development protein 2-like [Adelges cooleyi]|uniref:craniofacial development protein 2-like n=1 Tax=Adelges cooleyi TaxID=133065 RepID=UPI0021801638|nr:craniofacial development protein 2-like [Adelges cooleyi]